MIDCLPNVGKTLKLPNPGQSEGYAKQILPEPGKIGLPNLFGGGSPNNSIFPQPGKLGLLNAVNSAF